MASYIALEKIYPVYADTIEQFRGQGVEDYDILQSIIRTNKGLLAGGMTPEALQDFINMKSFEAPRPGLGERFMKGAGSALSFGAYQPELPEAVGLGEGFIDELAGIAGGLVPVVGTEALAGRALSRALPRIAGRTLSPAATGAARGAVAGPMFTGAQMAGQYAGTGELPTMEEGSQQALLNTLLFALGGTGAGIARGRRMAGVRGATESVLPGTGEQLPLPIGDVPRANLIGEQLPLNLESQARPGVQPDLPFPGPPRPTGSQMQLFGEQPLPSVGEQMGLGLEMPRPARPGPPEQMGLPLRTDIPQPMPEVTPEALLRQMGVKFGRTDLAPAGGSIEGTIRTRVQEVVEANLPPGAVLDDIHLTGSRASRLKEPGVFSDYDVLIELRRPVSEIAQERILLEGGALEQRVTKGVAALEEELGIKIDVQVGRPSRGGFPSRPLGGRSIENRTKLVGQDLAEMDFINPQVEGLVAELGHEPVMSAVEKAVAAVAPEPGIVAGPKAKKLPRRADKPLLKERAEALVADLDAAQQGTFKAKTPKKSAVTIGRELAEADMAAASASGTGGNAPDLVAVLRKSVAESNHKLTFVRDTKGRTVYRITGKDVPGGSVDFNDAKTAIERVYAPPKDPTVGVVPENTLEAVVRSEREKRATRPKDKPKRKC